MMHKNKIRNVQLAFMMIFIIMLSGITLAGNITNSSSYEVFIMNDTVIEVINISSISNEIITIENTDGNNIHVVIPDSSGNNTNNGSNSNSGNNNDSNSSNDSNRNNNNNSYGESYTINIRNETIIMEDNTTTIEDSANNETDYNKNTEENEYNVEISNETIIVENNETIIMEDNRTNEKSYRIITNKEEYNVGDIVEIELELPNNSSNSLLILSNNFSIQLYNITKQEFVVQQSGIYYLILEMKTSGSIDIINKSITVNSLAVNYSNNDNNYLNENLSINYGVIQNDSDNNSNNINDELRTIENGSNIDYNIISIDTNKEEYIIEDIIDVTLNSPVNSSNSLLIENNNFSILLHNVSKQSFVAQYLGEYNLIFNVLEYNKTTVINKSIIVRDLVIESNLIIINNTLGYNVSISNETLIEELDYDVIIRNETNVTEINNNNSNSNEMNSNNNTEMNENNSDKNSNIIEYNIVSDKHIYNHDENVSIFTNDLDVVIDVFNASSKVITELGNKINHIFTPDNYTAVATFNVKENNSNSIIIRTVNFIVIDNYNTANNSDNISIINNGNNTNITNISKINDSITDDYSNNDTITFYDEIIIKYNGREIIRKVKIDIPKELKNKTIKIKELEDSILIVNKYTKSDSILSDKDKIKKIRKEIYGQLKNKKTKLSVTNLTDTVKEIYFDDIILSGDFIELGIEDIVLDGKVQSYSIDPSNLNFTTATVKVTAKGTKLYKCIDWNYTTQNCYGEWDLFKDGIIPGEEYSFILTPTDPGFGEVMGGGLIQRGTVSGTASQLTDTITSINTSKAFILFRANTNDATPDDTQYTPDITSSTQIAFDRYDGGAVNSDIRWQVIESDDLSVQRGDEALLSGTNSVTVSINEIDLSETFVVVYGRCADELNSDTHAGLFSANLTNSTAVVLKRGNEGKCAATVSWQVVEWNGANVLSGSSRIADNSDSTTATISSVNTSQSFLIFGAASIGTDPGMDSNLIKGSIDSSTQISFTDEPGTTYASSQTDIEWYVVEIPGSYVQRGSTALGGDTTEAISAINMSQTFHISSGWNTGGGQTYTNSLYTINLSDSTTLQFDKETGSQTQNINWEVIQIPIATLPYIKWNQSSVDLGTELVGDGNLTKNVSIKSFKDNNNIIVDCVSGDCALISDSWIDSTNTNDEDILDISFECANNSVSVLSAVFNVTSNEDFSDNLITVNCEFTGTTTITWNDSEIDLGNTGQGFGNLSKITNITSDGINNNVIVNCVSGNCSLITDDFNDGTNMNDLDSISVDFTCSDSTLGSLSANFELISNEDIIADTITVNCNITDLTPPASITALNENSVGYEWIYWTWTNPVTSDFSYVEIWINGTNYANVSTNYYNATGFLPSKIYEIQTRTVDSSGNINTTWINDTAITTENILPQIILNSPENNDMFILDVKDIILDVTTSDPESDNTCVEIYGNNDTEIGVSRLLYKECNVLNDTTLTYNWTSPVRHENDYSSIVTLYHFDNISSYGESGSMFNDFASASGNQTATCINCPEIRFGSNAKFGGSLYFDGVDDMILPPADNADVWGIASTQRSFEIWINPSRTNVDELLIEEGGGTNGYCLMFTGTDLQWTAQDSNNIFSTTTTEPTIGEWTYVVGQFDNGNLSLWVNGLMVDSVDTTSLFTSVGAHSGDPAIGYQSGGDACDSATDGYYQGYMDEIVQHHDGILSAEDIMNNYRLKIGNWSWKVNISDRYATSESVTRTFEILIPDVINPNVTLVTPLQNYYNDSSELVNVTFNCSVSDNRELMNLSLVMTNNHNVSFIINETKNISGKINSSVFIKELLLGNYTWNCLGYDLAGNFDFGINRSIKINKTVDYVNPKVYLNRPTEGLSIDTFGIVEFNISATDNLGLNNCTLYTNVSGWQSDETKLFSDVYDSKIWSLDLEYDGDLLWNAECCDAFGNCNWNNTNYTANINMEYLPVVDTIFLNSSTWRNETDENMTLHYTITDQDIEDQSNLTGVIDWKLNDETIYVLNLPFTKSSNDTYTKEYSFNLSGIGNNITFNSSGTSDLPHNANKYGAYEFDGNSGSILTVENSDINQFIPEDNFTYMAWVKYNTIGTSFHVITEKGYGTNFLFAIAVYDGKVMAAVDTTPRTGLEDENDCMSTFDINNHLNEWHHVAATYDKQNIKIYIDGKLNVSCAETSDLNIVSNKWGIGSEYDPNQVDDTNWESDASITEAYVIRRALSEGQVGQYYNGDYTKMLSGETTGDDIWKACITPNDGKYDGNMACSNTLSVVEYVDEYPPNVSLVYPKDDALENATSTPTFTFNVTDEYATTLECWLNITDYETNTSGYYGYNSSVLNSTNTNITANNVLANGMYDWNVICFDGTNNATSNTWTLNVSIPDESAPSVTLSLPINNTVIDNTFYPEFMFNVSDDIATLLSCTLYIDNGTEFSAGQTVATANEFNNITSDVFLDDGNYSWRVSCNDGSNTNYSESWNFNISYVDITSPIISLIGPRNNSIEYAKTNKNYIFNVTDDDTRDSNNISCTLYHTNVETTDTYSKGYLDSVLQNTDLTIIATEGNTTEIEWYINCSDGENNIVQSETWSINYYDTIWLDDMELGRDAQNGNWNETYSTNTETFGIEGISGYVYGGDYSYADSRYSNYEISPAEMHLTAPVIDLSGYTAANLSFYHTYNIEISGADCADAMIIEVSTDGSNYNPITPISASYNTINSASNPRDGDSGYCGDIGWEEDSIVLDAYAGEETVYIRWTLVTNTDVSARGYNLDNVILFGEKDAINPITNLISPTNNTIFDNSGYSEINFTCNASDNIKVSELKLYIENLDNGSTYEYIETINSQNTTTSWLINLTNAKYSWNCQAKDVANNYAWTDNEWYFSVTGMQYQILYGNVSGEIMLGIDEDIIYSFGIANVTNVYVADYDSIIDWTKLQAIGKQKDNSSSTNDFAEIDTSLNLTQYNYNINRTYSIDGSIAKESKTFRVHDNIIDNVAIINSTNSTTFKTGILWDTSDSIDNEYDLIEKEDLVFVTKTNISQQGKYGVYDYEIKIPATLDEYKSGTDLAIIYLELE